MRILFLTQKSFTLEKDFYIYDYSNDIMTRVNNGKVLLNEKQILPEDFIDFLKKEGVNFYKAELLLKDSPLARQLSSNFQKYSV